MPCCRASSTNTQARSVTVPRPNRSVSHGRFGNVLRLGRGARLELDVADDPVEQPPCPGKILELLAPGRVRDVAEPHGLLQGVAVVAEEFEAVRATAPRAVRPAAWATWPPGGRVSSRRAASGSGPTGSAGRRFPGAFRRRRTPRAAGGCSPRTGSTPRATRPSCRAPASSSAAESAESRQPIVGSSTHDQQKRQQGHAGGRPAGSGKDGDHSRRCLARSLDENDSRQSSPRFGEWRPAGGASGRTRPAGPCSDRRFARGRDPDAFQKTARRRRGDRRPGQAARPSPDSRRWRRPVRRAPARCAWRRRRPARRASRIWGIDRMSTTRRP